MNKSKEVVYSITELDLNNLINYIVELSWRSANPIIQHITKTCLPIQEEKDEIIKGEVNIVREEEKEKGKEDTNS